MRRVPDGVPKEIMRLTLLLGEGRIDAGTYGRAMNALAARTAAR